MWVSLCVFIRTVLLVSPDEDAPPEVQSVFKQLSGTHPCNRDVTLTLIQHSFQAALGSKHNLQALNATLQVTHLHHISLYVFIPLCLFVFD